MAKLPEMARLHYEVERKIHAALEAERAEQKPSSKHVRLSSIGKCVRELWAIRQGVPEERPPNGQTLITFDVGHHLEEMVVSHLRKAGYDVLNGHDDGSQIRVEMPGAVGVGHIDGMIPWGREKEWRLLEIKTAKAKKFAELHEAGSYRAWNPGYYDQIQAYMGASEGMLEVPTLQQALVMVICKDDSSLYSEMVAFDPERYAGLLEKAQAVMAADTVPDRPKEGKSHGCKFCRWCSVNAWCWSGLAGVEFDE